MSRLSSVPSVERILQSEGAAVLSDRYGRPLTLDAIRLSLEEVRGELRTEPNAATPKIEEIVAQAQTHLTAWTQGAFEQVINATGVILHTNLGRAPLAAAAIAAMAEVSRGYSNLELDLATGKRGQRDAHLEALLRNLTGAEAALIVNNNAAAVLLALSALAWRKPVIIARSQLVEIGGGFRMPDVMRQSGARLVEVGTTNKVRLADYERELNDSKFVMRAHRSNFKMVGFVEEPEFKHVVQAAHQAGATVLDDLGSGALLDTAKFGLAHEPTVQDSLAAGADLICFSGDKLLGGPQAGIIVGRAELVEKLRKHPLARAVRADKTCLAGTGATLLHYLRNEAEREIPVWRMMSMPAVLIERRAREWAAGLGSGDVIASQSTLGGGSLPGETLPSYVLSLGVRSPSKFLAHLRRQNPPVVARTEKDRILLDPRTVLPDQDALLVDGLRRQLSEST